MVFYGTNNCQIYVPCDSVEDYKAATNWSTYASTIQAILGSCWDIAVRFNVTDTTNPTMIAYKTNEFSKIEIDGVEQPSVVSGYTFNTTGEHTVKYNLTETSIGNEAFSGCSGLISCTIGSGVTSIGASAFTYCSGLTSIDIPDGVTSIGNYAFAECSSLTSINIPDSVTSIGNAAFQNCGSLSSIDIPSGVTSIGYKTFQNCTSLTSVDIPDSVTIIGNYGFAECSSLTSCTIGSGVTTIGNYAFERCGGLTSVDIPDSVTIISRYAFYNCSSLSNITSLATTAPTISYDTFQGVNTNGTLTVLQSSSGYDVWMQNANYYLGLYSWNKVEQ